MQKTLKLACKGYSDKDFIFDIFSDNGFVTDANQYLHSNHHNDLNTINTDINDVRTEVESET
ncbi:MAG: hypothetical protein N4A71_11495 [Carboxylicivirga sp.]|jgi:hypothetical protein|nr:hypothetical protein [Carboxylicivirga sp.]